ncbi:methylase of polypeptide subunit release factors [Microbacteriaceae bacterium SG_E_30_P1]|uniref:Methylase of polypeptide subunit release factors n=1 Tax=Antiquaquibacter oligotrophicus TaxID=2880260 RepID=A0ABT6KPR3_9MICO|nr:50S ribosomal protein L11 methyltransferase [Antiquaquibacter oligotrophicus]MDH6181849.1 methylase of polypeptide subunit release factors [Antiquaquibacter oligotrophicus]UDF12474.1 50S ribosomal protein L11 methyltransferase [Antiquaquibacter oligotrophicus]
MSSTLQLPVAGASWQEWHRFGGTLAVPDGVHRPSPFSAELAASLPRLDGKVVIDGGAGAGLITIAALAAGAEHVIALDLYLDALVATRANVGDVLGPEAERRVSLLRTDFRMLRLVNADVLVANPPQRPTALLEGLTPGERALHGGAGPTGLGAIQLLLDHSGVSEIWTTAAGLLDIDSLDLGDWTREFITSAHVPMDPVWKTLGDDDRVTIWRFSR